LNKSLTLPRQALYHLSHSSLFCPGMAREHNPPSMPLPWLGLSAYAIMLSPFLSHFKEPGLHKDIQADKIQVCILQGQESEGCLYPRYHGASELESKLTQKHGN
jgi:hypothetical protein